MLTKGCFLDTLQITVLLYCKTGCFYFYVLCIVAFLSNFLNMKQVNIKMKILEVL